jgi:hypothetical protein
MFLPALTVPYAFSDDYPVLSIAVGFGPTPSFGSSIIDTAAARGRPFAGLLDQLAFSTAGTIENLRFVRLAAVVGIVALALLLHWALVRARFGAVPAALIALLVCSLPAFQVYASWAVLFNVPYAALLGAGASVLALWAAEAQADLKLDRLMGAGALLLAALLTYQPAALFFWVFAEIALFGAANDRDQAFRIVRTHAGVAAAIVPVAFAIAKLAIARSEAPNPERNSLVHDLGGKLHWFFSDPLKRGLNLLDLTPSWWLAGVVAALALVGLPLLLRRRTARPLPFLALALLLVPLSYLPNLVVEENSATYRTLLALSALIGLYAGLGALGLWLTVRDRLRAHIGRDGLVTADRAAAATAAALVALCAAVATKNITTLFVEPQMTELRLMRSQVAALPEGFGRVAFVGTSYREGMEELTVGDEFGIPSTSQRFVAQPAVLLLLREQGRLSPGSPPPVVDTFLWYTIDFPKGEPLIDVRRELRRLR